MDTEGDATSFYDPNGEVDIEEGKNRDGVRIQEISINLFLIESTVRIGF